MDNIVQLIQSIANESAGIEAAAQLVSIGMPAVPGIVDAIKTDKGATWLLCEVLAQIRRPDIVPVLIELLEEQNRDLRMTAFSALGKSRDDRALQPLLATLATWKKYLAAGALGDLGNPKAIPKLLEGARNILNNPFAIQAIEGKTEVAEEVFDRDDLRFLVESVIALAKLGNYEVAHVLVPLTQYFGGDVDTNAFYIRKEAVRAMQYVVIPGMFAALQTALHDDNTDVCLAAVDAIFYLGVRETIPELISCLQGENSIVSNNVLFRLQCLTGQSFDEDASIDKLQEWWRLHQAEYDHGVCYRLGKPLYVPDIIMLLTDQNQVRPVLQELQIITGNDFGSNPNFPLQSQDELLSLAQKWWEVKGHRFEQGALYKSGRKQDIAAVF